LFVIYRFAKALVVDGDAGAPIEETKILEDIYPKVKPFTQRKDCSIEAQGTWTNGNRW
jgi:hypothetical protein